MIEPDDYTRQKICSLSEKLLQAAEFDLGNFPTPLSLLEAKLNLGPTLDLAELLDEVSESPRRVKNQFSRLKSSARRIFGATFHRSRLVVVDFSRNESHVRWTQAHEFGHVLLPWHGEVAYLDDRYTLSPETRQRQEREAHLVANHLLYQGDRGMGFALDHRHGLAAAIAMSGHTFTSIDASIRHYCESHPDPVALLRGGRYLENGGYPILGTYASESFKRDFGPVSSYFPLNQLPVHHHDPENPWLRGLVRESHTEDTPSIEIQLVSPSGLKHKFVAEAFFNRYTHFVMLTAKRRRIARGVKVTTGTPGQTMSEDDKR